MAFVLAPLNTVFAGLTIKEFGRLQFKIAGAFDAPQRKLIFNLLYFKILKCNARISRGNFLSKVNNSMNGELKYVHFIHFKLKCAHFTEINCSVLALSSSKVFLSEDQIWKRYTFWSFIPDVYNEHLRFFSILLLDLQVGVSLITFLPIHNNLTLYQ